MKTNTLIEGFVLVTPAGTRNQLDNVTATNRGEIVAVDLIASEDTQNPYFLSLVVGGQSIVSNMANKCYVPSAYPNHYLLIPLEINDGQTFTLDSDATLSAGPETTNVIFLRKGATTSYKRNSKLSTYILSLGLFQFPVSSFTSFEGVIPKNRGKCIGFELIKSNNGFSQDDQTTTVTFSVGGVELILNAPWSIFDTAFTRAYTKLFVPLESGSTFKLDVNASAGQPRIMTVNFYFEN